MKKISVIAPVKKPEDIEAFVPKTSCRAFYVYHHKFFQNYEYVQKFIKTAHEHDSKIYVNFKHNITEEDLIEITQMIKYLKNTEIDGIFINSFAIIKAIKGLGLPFEIIIDSYFDIHNIAGIDFVNNFHKIDKLIVTEEIYMKNIAKIKKYTNLSLAVDADNIPWCAEAIKDLGAIDNVVIKGKFKTSSDILEGLELVEKILENPNEYKEKKLPFKHVRRSTYQTNHFSGDMISAAGRNFKFSKHIFPFEWKALHSGLKKQVFEFDVEKIPKINLRLSKLAHLKTVKTFIKRLGYNPIYSIEFGEIVSTSDIAKYSFSKIITKVKKFCFEQNINFQFSTPRILTERDFDRVYEYVKSLALLAPYPDTVIINNLGYLWCFINDSDLKQFPIEIGQSINLLNSMSIQCLNNLHTINTVDFSSFEDKENIIQTVKKVKNLIPHRKLTIAGNKRIPASGLCPLNSCSAIIPRLSCKAPCHNGNFALKDPALKKIMPFTCDGFCRMHLFEHGVMQNFDDISEFLTAGINEFSFDFVNLPASYIPTLLTNFLNSLV